MEYRYTAQNVACLLRMVPFVTEEQMIRFFERELEPMKLIDILDNMIIDHRILRQVQSEKYEVYTCIRPIRFKESAVVDFIDAFWVIAAMGSENVRWITCANGPTRYVVTLEDEQSTTYDITVCRTAEMARVGLVNRDIKDGELDDINHIALCESVEAGNEMKAKLKAFGYDTFCVIDEETHDVTYYDIGG